MKLTKTAALKGALLMVLAANVSWEHIEFGSTQLASELTTGSGAAKTAAPTASGPISQTPENLGVKMNGAGAPVPVKVHQEVAAAPVPKLTQPSEQKLKIICGEVYRIDYIQTEEDGVTQTRVTANPASAALPALKVDFTEAVTKNQAVDENGIVEHLLLSHVAEKRKRAKLSCANREEVKVAETKDAKRSEKDEELAEDIKNCRRDKHGKELSKSSQLTCWTDAIEHADKRVSKKNEDGKRLSEEAYSKAILAEVERAQKELKRILKSELLSKDESRVEEAKEAATDAMNAIEEIAVAHDLGKSKKTGKNTNAASRLIREISALKHGAETHEKAEELKEQLSDDKKSFQNASEGLKSAFDTAMQKPGDFYARVKWEEAKRKYLASQNELTLLTNYISNPYGDFQQNYLGQLNDFKSDRLLSQEDYRLFTQPFTDIEKLMKESFGNDVSSRRGGGPWGSTTGSAGIPNGLADRRSSAMTGMFGAGGTFSAGASPLAPTLNLPPLPNAQPTSIFNTTPPRL